MTVLRVIAVIHALSLMIGEAWRSWGVDRPLVFVLDDQILGVLLIAGAIAMSKDTVRRRALFGAGWGFSAGMLYGSFFGKLVDPASTNAGNWDLDVLTILVGVAFATAVIGLVCAVLLPPARSAD